MGRDENDSAVILTFRRQKHVVVVKLKKTTKSKREPTDPYWHISQK